MFVNSPAEPATGESVYLVLDDFGEIGQAYRETDPCTDVETILRLMLTGEYINPLKVVAFNIEQGWSADVSADFARELRLRAEAAGKELPDSTLQFVERHESPWQPLLPFRVASVTSPLS